MPPKIQNKNWKVIEDVGTGGFGVVWRAERTTGDIRGGPYALKQIRFRKTSDANNALREAGLMMRLQHPHIVEVKEVFLDKTRGHDSVVLVMPFMAYGDLTALCKQAPVREAQAMTVLGHIGNALLYVHGRGVIHRDIKPQNILRQSENQFLLADFGLASQDPVATRCCGTKRWMAPEVEANQGKEYDSSADIWSFGAVMWALLTAPHLRSAGPRRPMLGDSVSQQVLSERVGRMLSFEPANRPDAALVCGWSGYKGQCPIDAPAGEEEPAKRRRIDRQGEAGVSALRQLVAGMTVGDEVQTFPAFWRDEPEEWRAFVRELDLKDDVWARKLEEQDNKWLKKANDEDLCPPGSAEALKDHSTEWIQKMAKHSSAFKQRRPGSKAEITRIEALRRGALQKEEAKQRYAGVLTKLNKQKRELKLQKREMRDGSCASTGNGDDMTPTSL